MSFEEAESPEVVDAAAEILRERSIEASRVLAKRSFASFVQEAWPLVEADAIAWGRHHDLICRDVEDLFYLRKRSHVICVPPGCSKSSLCDVFHVPWLFTQDPSLRVGVFSFDADKLRTNGDHVITIMTSEWYRDRWGDLLKDPNQAARGYFETKRGGYRFSSTPKGKATGWHFDYRIFDDLCKPEEVLAAITGALTLEKVQRWRSRTMATRIRNTKTHRTLGIGQRLHEDDPPGEMIKEGFTHRVLPMRFDPNHPQRDPDDWRTKPGELLEPQRFPEEEVQKIEVKLGRADADAQLQQDPSAPGGTFVSKDEVIEVPDALWPRKEEGLWGMSVDAAFKKKEATSAVAIGVWQWVADQWWLWFASIEKMTFTETCKAIIDTRAAWPRVRRILVEDKANGPAIIDHLTTSLGIGGIEPIETGVDSKAARFHSVTHYFREKKVNVPVIGSQPWVGEYVYQITKFPRISRNDAVDMTSQALSYLGPTSHELKLLAMATKFQRTQGR